MRVQSVARGRDGKSGACHGHIGQLEMKFVRLGYGLSRLGFGGGDKALLFLCEICSLASGSSKLLVFGRLLLGLLCQPAFGRNFCLSGSTGASVSEARTGGGHEWEAPEAWREGQDRLGKSLHFRC